MRTPRCMNTTQRTGAAKNPSKDRTSGPFDLINALWIRATGQRPPIRCSTVETCRPVAFSSLVAKRRTVHRIPTRQGSNDHHINVAAWRTSTGECATAGTMSQFAGRPENEAGAAKAESAVLMVVARLITQLSKDHLS